MTLSLSPSLSPPFSKWRVGDPYVTKHTVDIDWRSELSACSRMKMPAFMYVFGDIKHRRICLYVWQLLKGLRRSLGLARRALDPAARCLTIIVAGKCLPKWTVLKVFDIGLSFWINRRWEMIGKCPIVAGDGWENPISIFGTWRTGRFLLYVDFLLYKTFGPAVSFLT